MPRRKPAGSHRFPRKIFVILIVAAFIVASIFVFLLHLHVESKESNWQFKQETHRQLNAVTPASNAGAGLSTAGPMYSEPARTPDPFALIPRPVYLHSISSGIRPTHQTQCSSRIGFWLDAGPYRTTEGRIQAMLAAFMDFAGTQIQQLSAIGDDPLCLVSITLHSTISNARAACTSRSQGSDAQYSRNLQIPEEAVPEWHIAVLLNSVLQVCAVEPQGAFRFAASLQQMIRTGLSGQTEGQVQERKAMSLGYFLRTAPPFILEDWPRYTWRGLHLDTVRHFMPVSFLKRYLRAMAYYKANVFHWHLTDDQAWRLFIPSRPKLVNASALTSPGFYSPEEVHEIIKYAADRFITIVPGIETPGHSLAALAAYPELACFGSNFKTPKKREGVYKDILCVMTEATNNFAQDVFADVAQLFPGKFVHIGGDETPTIRWTQNEELRSFVHSKNLGNFDVDIFEAWLCFVTALLRKHGKTPIMWDDHFSKRGRVTQKCPDAERDWVVQAWLLEPPLGSATRDQVDPTFPFRAIASPYNQVYLDQPVGTINFSHAAKFSPGHRNSKLLGGCAAMWTEHTEPEEVPSSVYPRYLAISDRLWGSSISAADVRPLDMNIQDAAVQHCSDVAALKEDFSFSCGKFNLPWNLGPSKVWAGARAKTDMQTWAPEYSADRAVDGNEDTYFWAISPQRHQTFQIGWQSESGTVPKLGKWFCQMTVVTGSRDRPDDTLDSAEIRLLQWVLDDSTQFQLRLSRATRLERGQATIDEDVLRMGPILSLKITVLQSQVKWMTLPEISGKLCAEPPNHPSQEDLPSTISIPLDSSAG